MKRNYRILVQLAKALPILIIIAMLIGFLIAFLINRPDFAIRGLGIAIPSFLSAFLLLRIYKENPDLKDSITLFQSFNQRTLISLFGILFAISICILLVATYRPWYYFVLISALYVLIFIQIFSKNTTPVIILLEIAFIMMNLIYSVTLKYPLYFGGTDTLGHIFLSEVTYLSGQVVPEDLSIGYAYFPLYHIFIAESSYILGLDIKTSLFIVTCILYVITVIFIYHLFNQIIQNKQISLLACILYSMSSIVVYYGTYMITRTLAFVGFIILLYLLYKGADDNKRIIYEVLAIFMAVFLILVHQVSMPQIVILLFILFICEWIVNAKKYLNGNFFMLLNVMFLGYWLYTAWLFTESVLRTHTRPVYFEHVTMKQSIQPENMLYFLQTHIDSSIFLFFALIGIGYILWRQKPRYASVFGLFSLATLILYVPNPIQTVWQVMTLFRSDRFMLLLTPFMALIMGYGVYTILNYPIRKKIPRTLSICIVVFLIGVFAFTSIAADQNASDCIDLWQNTPTRYFTNVDLSTFDFCERNVPNGSVIHSDYFVIRYFGCKRYFKGSDDLGLNYYRSVGIDSPEHYPFRGYILYRKAEFSEKKILNFGRSSERYSYEYVPENVENLERTLNKFNKIYSCEKHELYWKDTGRILRRRI